MRPTITITPIGVARLTILKIFGSSIAKTSYVLVERRPSATRDRSGRGVWGSFEVIEVKNMVNRALTTVPVCVSLNCPPKGAVRRGSRFVAGSKGVPSTSHGAPDGCRKETWRYEDLFFALKLVATLRQFAISKEK
jgi:hypothetical protein